MSTTYQQLCFKADEDSKKSIWEYSSEPTFGRPKVPNRKIPVDHQAAPYYQLCARRPCSDTLRKTIALAAKYPIHYSENMDEATKKANFLEFCSLAQKIQYVYDDFDEWAREMALETQILCGRNKLDDQSFFKWVENHDQYEIEFKLARNKTVLHNLDVENIKKTQELMVRGYGEHKSQIEAEEKRKQFKCAFEAQLESAGHVEQFAKAEDQKGSSKTIEHRIESNNSRKGQEAENPARKSGESEFLKARTKEEIQQEFIEKARVAATKCSKSTSSVSTSTRDPIAPSVPATATSPLSFPAVPPLSRSFASTQTSLCTSAIQPKTSAVPPSPSRSLSASPSTEGTSRDLASSGPASPHSLSTSCTTPPSTRQVSPPKASSAIATPSKSPADPTSSASAISGQGPVFGSPSKPRRRLPPRPIASAAPPQAFSSTRYTMPRHRPTPPEWVYPLSLCTLIISNMPYVPVEACEAMMRPTEAVLRLPHTSVLRTLATAMNVHPSLLLYQNLFASQEARPRNADAKEIEYLIFGLRAWWHAIYPKPTTREAAFARLSEREQFEEPLREAFERAEKAEIKSMARMVWGLVRKRGPGVSLTWEAGETVREWLGWERGELGFWD